MGELARARRCSLGLGAIARPAAPAGARGLQEEPFSDAVADFSSQDFRRSRSRTGP
jgi:hypothetical protein